MKEGPWPRVLTIMGKEGDHAMIDLILDCGIFVPIKSAHGSYNQLSGNSALHAQRLRLIRVTGNPLGDLQILPQKVASAMSPRAPPPTITQRRSRPLYTPANIVFVRNRMLYAKAALNAQGGVRFGLRHIRTLIQ